jgi:hypothetical protein
MAFATQLCQERVHSEAKVHWIRIAALAGVRIDVEEAVALEEPIRIPRRRSRNIGDRSSQPIPEFEVAVGERNQRVAGLVHEAVVTAAQKNEVVDVRLAASSPVLDLVPLQEAPVLAAREATTLVTCLQGTTDRGRDRASLSTDREGLAVAFPDLDERGRRKRACALSPH